MFYHNKDKIHVNINGLLRNAILHAFSTKTILIDGNALHRPVGIVEYDVGSMDAVDIWLITRS